MGTWYMDFGPSLFSLVSSLKVTLDRKGRMVSFGSAFLNLRIAVRGNFPTSIFGCFDAVLDEREIDGELSLVKDAPLSFRIECAIPSFGNIFKKPSVGSKEGRGGDESSDEIRFLE